MSADGTGHKKINYNSHHANYKISDSHGKKTQVTHFLGIERSLDGSIGMYSDHCAKEKKNVNLMKAKKMDATEQLLGEKKILNDLADELWLIWLLIMRR